MTLARPLPDAVRRALEALPAVGHVAEDPPGELRLRLRVASAAERESAVGCVLRCLLDRDAVPRALSPGASLEARYLEITGGVAEEEG